MLNVQPTLALRKNKLRPSCEACRVSKLRCDHHQPCSRCVRRRRECVYAENPMTKTLSDAPDRQASQRREESIASPEALISALSLDDGLDPLLLPTKHAYHERTDVSFGYMGPTGHSAILLEHQDHFDAADPGEASSPNGNASTNSDAKARQKEQRRLQRTCLAILDCLPTTQAMNTFLELKGEDTHLLEQFPINLPFMVRFYEHFGHALGDTRDASKLLEISETLCQNTKRCIEVPKTNVEFLDFICGPNSRWEMIGHLFADIAVFQWNLPDCDPLLQALGAEKFGGKRESCCRMLDCADACYTLSTTQFGQVNVLSVGLYVFATWLQSMVGGDSSLSLWLRRGAAASAVTAFGLHRNLEADQGPRARVYLQIERMVCANMCCIDTILPTFLGRPPALSQRFVTCPPPLDISAEVALDESIPLEGLIDENGWNTLGKVWPGTQWRAFCFEAPIRHEILELCLGHTPPNRDAYVADLRRRLDKSYQGLPPILHTPIDRLSYRIIDSMTISLILATQLFHLHSSFLLERYEQSHKGSSSLLSTASKMLSTTVTMYTLRDKLPGMADGIVWHICAFGVPAASALAIDLWKQTVSSSGQQFSPDRPTTIQDLSVFISCLEWVEPEFGNYSLCQSVHKMIKGILDRVLLPVAPSAPAPTQEPVDVFDLGGISINELPTFGFQFEDWYENMDWDAMTSGNGFETATYDQPFQSL